MRISEIRKLRKETEVFFQRVYDLWEKEEIQEEKDVLADFKGELFIYIKELQDLEFDKLTGGYKSNGYKLKLAREKKKD